MGHDIFGAWPPQGGGNPLDTPMLHCIDNEQTKHRIEWELSQMLAHSFTRIFCPVFSFCSMFDPALLRLGLVFYLYVYVCVCVWSVYVDSCGLHGPRRRAACWDMAGTQQTR